MTVQLPGSVSVVTGAGSGIGRATARALSAAGSRVAAIDCDHDSVRSVASEIDGEAFVADVSARAEMEATAQTVLKRMGVPDVLVNNAGVGLTGRFLDTSEEHSEWILDVNLKGVLHGCQVFGPAMLSRGRGQVLNVSSGLAYAPRATEPAYVTTKAAVLALTRCLRADWGPRGVGVSAICPGIIATSIVERARYRGERAAISSVVRVRRAFAHGHPPEIVAHAIVDAVRRDRPVVPVGIEARIGWMLQGIVPARIVDRAARSTITDASAPARSWTGTRAAPGPFSAMMGP